MNIKKTRPQLIEQFKLTPLLFNQALKDLGIKDDQHTFQGNDLTKIEQKLATIAQKADNAPKADTQSPFDQVMGAMGGQQTQSPEQAKTAASIQKQAQQGATAIHVIEQIMTAHYLNNPHEITDPALLAQIQDSQDFLDRTIQATSQFSLGNLLAATDIPLFQQLPVVLDAKNALALPEAKSDASESHSPS